MSLAAECSAIGMRRLCGSFGREWGAEQPNPFLDAFQFFEADQT